MKKLNLVNIFAFFVLIFLINIGILYSQKTHPKIEDNLKLCSNCHNDSKKELNHYLDFIEKHKFVVSKNAELCFFCHSEAFCSDCHTKKDHLKPSYKYSDEADSFLKFPHPGDYINQHKIDGRVNPASCFKCHGRYNNDRCKTCHR